MMRRIYVVLLLLVVAMVGYTAALVQYIGFTSLSDFVPVVILIAIELLLGIFAIVVAMRIILKQTYAYHKSHWILLMIFNPFVGILMYLVFARDFTTRRLEKTRPLIAERKFLAYEEPTSPVYGKYDYGSIFRFAHDMTRRSVYEDDTSTEILDNGDVFFPRLIQELKAASEYIMMEFYIIKTDKIGRAVLSILGEKAASGVQVHLIYDHFGSERHLDRAFMKQLSDSGVKIAVFDPQKLAILNANVNFRNHRKATIIDGKVGFVGGLNLADEYNHGSPKFGFWRDTHLLIKGNGVTSIQNVFCKDWYYITNNVLEFPLDKTKAKCPGLFTVIESGPDFENGLIMDVYQKMLTSAKHSIQIVTPYLILEPEMLALLKLAVKSNVDVSILVPGKSDFAFVGFATRSYYETLLEQGVKIYEYPGFVHSKILLIDEAVASVGSVNFDPRSFRINFEVTAVFMNSTVDDLVESFQNDLAKSKPIDYALWRKRSFLIRLLQGFFNLFSPLF